MYITSRIKLEELRPDHAEPLYELIDKSRSELLNLAWAEAATLESVKKFIDTPRGKRNVILVNGKIAGMIETWMPDADGFVTLGYWLGTEFRGYGIMQLVVKKVTDLIVSYAPIKAKIRRGNKKSLRMLQAGGFTIYGLSTDWVYFMRPQKDIANWVELNG